MLGKGLESLIPPHQRSDDHGTGQAPQDGNDGDNNGGVNPAPFDLGSQSPAPVGPLTEERFEPHPALPPSVPSGGGGSVPLRSAPKPEEISSEDHIYHIEVEKIVPNPSQPRRNFDENAIRELAYSIREFGFLQPLVVTRKEHETESGVGVAYELIAGERRLLAAKMLGLQHVPVIIRNVSLEREKLELAVIENIQRENLNPIETARALARLQDEFRLTQREIAAKLGKSRETVANAVRLLGLPMNIQVALEKNEISESHGRLLLTVEDPASQRKLFDDLLSYRMTTRELKARVEAAKPKKPQTPAETPSPELKMMEDKLSMELGTPVKIERGANNGKIVITFYSEEELENLVQKIGKEE
jgi:ParB family transcriptional regulator, chromosome partitioning protein